MTLTSDYARAEEAGRGEIWDIDLGESVGSEIKKTRPGVIISSDGLKRLPLRLIVPITGWKSSHEHSWSCVTIKPSIKNGLEKKSTADTLQTRCVSIKRLVGKKGCVSTGTMEEIVTALAAIVEYT